MNSTFRAEYENSTSTYLHAVFSSSAIVGITAAEVVVDFSHTAFTIGPKLEYRPLERPLG